MPRVTIGPRAQALALLLATATLGATVGIMGDRLLAQQREQPLAPVSEPVTNEPVHIAPPEPTQETQPPARTATPEPEPEPEPEDTPAVVPVPQPPQPRPNVPYADRVFALLELSPEQRAAVDSLMDVQQSRVRELARQIQPQFQAITRETQQQIHALLTPEQRTRLRMLQQERNRLMREGRIGPPQQQRFEQREEILRYLRQEQNRRLLERARQLERRRGPLPQDTL